MEEASAYLDHVVLGTRLRECAEAVLAVEGKSALSIFGSPDDIKLHSSMTLFTEVDGENPVFVRVLEKYFGRQQDNATLKQLGQAAQS